MNIVGGIVRAFSPAPKAEAEPKIEVTPDIERQPNSRSGSEGSGAYGAPGTKRRSKGSHFIVGPNRSWK